MLPDLNGSLLKDFHELSKTDGQIYKPDIADWTTDGEFLVKTIIMTHQICIFPLASWDAAGLLFQLNKIL